MKVPMHAAFELERFREFLSKFSASASLKGQHFKAIVISLLHLRKKIGFYGPDSLVLYRFDRHFQVVVHFPLIRLLINLSNIKMIFSGKLIIEPGASWVRCKNATTVPCSPF